MTTDRLLEELASRKITIILIDGQPRLRGNKAEVTPALLRTIRWHKDEIVRRLTVQHQPIDRKPRTQMDEPLRDVFRQCATEGVWLVLKDNGSPAVRGGTPSTELQALLYRNREAILGWLQEPPAPREWLWRTGHVGTEDLRYPDLDAPAGAFWWRFVGEEAWQVIAGREDHVAALGVTAVRALEETVTTGQVDGEMSSTQRQDAEPVHLDRT